MKYFVYSFLVLISVNTQANSCQKPLEALMKCNEEIAKKEDPDHWFCREAIEGKCVSNDTVAYECGEVKLCLWHSKQAINKMAPHPRYKAAPETWTKKPDAAKP